MVDSKMETIDYNLELFAVLMETIVVAEED